MEWKGANGDVAIKKPKQMSLFNDKFIDNINGGTDLDISVNVSSKSLTQVENKFKKNVNSIYSGRLLFFILTAGMNYLRLKYGKDTIQNVFKKKYKNVNDFMDSVNFTGLDSIVLITFGTWDVIKFCQMNNLDRFHKALKEVRESVNITLEDIVEDIKDRSIYEGSLLADYYLDANDKTIKFHINVKVLLAYLYKLTIKGYQNIKLEDINQIEGSVNELVLYLNLAGKFRYKEALYNIETVKALFRKEEVDNRTFVKFLGKLLKKMNKKNYPYVISIETIKVGRKVRQIRFKFEKNKVYQESMFDANNQNIIVGENLKEDIKQYFSQKYSVKLDESDINYIASEVAIQGISLNDFVSLLPSNVIKQQIFDIIDFIKHLDSFGEIFSLEEKEKIIKNLIKNNRDKEYLKKWIKFVKGNPRVDSKKAYLISMINSNAEPTEYKDNSKPKNFLHGKKVEFEINRIEI